MFGMKIMSEAIQKIAGSRMRKTLEPLSSNRARGILSGFIITSLIQSSSATTVLVVGFVNAGLLTLVESIGIIMGANIGTTITAWLITILGFKVNIAALTLPMIGIGFPMTFSKKNSVKSWGEFLIGFSLLFMGLNELKNSVPDLSHSPEVLSFLSQYTDYGLLSVLLFVMLGMVFTMLIQSSSATMAIILVLTNEGWVPFDLAASIILGANIGTTITANLAALVGNVYAKRAALSHLIINVIGVVWMIIFLPVFLNIIEVFLQKVYRIGSLENLQSEGMLIALSLFHTVFNLVNVLILVWFIPGIAKISEVMIAAKPAEEFRLQHISSQVVMTSEIQMLEARKEMLVSAKILKKMSFLLEDLIKNPSTDNWKQSLEKIKEYKLVTDRIEIETANFLMKVSESNISDRSSKEIRSILRINSNLESVGDIYFKMSLLIQRARESSIKFNQKQIDNLIELFVLIDEARNIMKHNLMAENGRFDFNRAIQKEREIDAKRNEIRREHLKSIDRGDYSIHNGIFYNDLFTSCEEIGDHLLNVSYAIAEERNIK